tara:strand:+ start:6098 stop:6724 length:627 start_codon:yes stop_codon:yes gene_type:complete
VARADYIGALCSQVRAAVAAGVDLIQIREIDLSDHVLFDLVSRSVDIARGTQSVILVNDRFDVALAAGAGGTHLRASSMAAGLLRPHLPSGFVLGRSVHDLGEALKVSREGALDYVTMGTVFPSKSHPGERVCGVDALSIASRAVTIPMLAIGGVTSDNIEMLFGAGVVGVAAVGLFADPGSFGEFEAMGSIVAKIRGSYMEKHVQRD